MKIIPVIMAGGKGERFWPKSRKSLPKQFLNILGERSMLQATVDRIMKMAPLNDVYIATGEEYAELVRNQLPALPVRNLILEPVGKNTAPCIGLAASVLNRYYGPDAVMVVIPSDHMILDELRYLEVLQAGAQAVQDPGDSLLTIGITPTGPETGYGYIKTGDLTAELGKEKVYRVERFVEKPDAETARCYIESGNYLWNSGMFIFRAATILDNIATHLPDLRAALERIESAAGSDQQYNDVLDREYRALQSISIDYGVMEKAEQVMVVPGEFGWDDVGSWTSLERIGQSGEEKNIIRGNVISLDNHGCIVEAGSKQRLVAILGADDLIVVDTEDATLICPKDRAQEIKKILENINEQRLQQYL